MVRIFFSFMTSFFDIASKYSNVSQYFKEGKDKRFMNFLREKIHVLEEESIRLYPSLSMQSHLKMYKPSLFSINFNFPAGPKLEKFAKF